MKYTIYSHDDTDGAIAALILRTHLACDDAVDVHIQPVAHGDPHHPPWLQRQIHRPCAVVDFSLHPVLLAPSSDAPAQQSYWIDHHATGIGPHGESHNDPKTCFESLAFPPDVTAIWDPQARSTPGLMRAHASELGLEPSLLQSLGYLIDVAEIVDGALYQSPEEAHDFSQFSVRLCTLFSTKHPLIARNTLYTQLINLLDSCRTEGRPFQHIFAMEPLLETLLEQEESLTNRKILSYQQQTAVMGNVAVCDYRNKPQSWLGIGRFIPYLLHPECTSAIHIFPASRGPHFEITAGVNPWNKPKRHFHIGRFFAVNFAGGGHAFVAGGRLDAQATPDCTEKDPLRVLIAKLADL